jgi:hypothetical protein
MIVSKQQMILRTRAIQERFSRFVINLRQIQITYMKFTFYFLEYA